MGLDVDDEGSNWSGFAPGKMYQRGMGLSKREKSHPEPDMRQVDDF